MDSPTGHFCTCSGPRFPPLAYVFRLPLIPPAGPIGTPRGLDPEGALFYLPTIMALLPIIIAPDPRLKMVCAEVTNITPEIFILMDDMLDTMYSAPGIGLAAPQVGVTKRIIVADVCKEENKREPRRLINPEISWKSDEMFAYEEGCLSLPEQYSDVARPKEVGIRYLDEKGKRRELEAEGLLAVCLQHEMDHLDGILFVDHISSLKRNVILRKLKKLKKLENAG